MELIFFNNAQRRRRLLTLFINKNMMRGVAGFGEQASGRALRGVDSAEANSSLNYGVLETRVSSILYGIVSHFKKDYVCVVKR